MRSAVSKQILDHANVARRAMLPGETDAMLPVGYDIDFNSNSLDVYVQRIRIEKDPLKPRYLLTLRGFGSKFQSADSDAA